MSNIFNNAKKSTPQTRVSTLKDQGALEPDEKLVYHSARVPESLSKAVKRLAVDESASVQELTTEALSLLLENRGITPN